MYAPVCAVHGAPLYISSRLYPAADVRDAAPGGATARSRTHNNDRPHTKLSTHDP